MENAPARTRLVRLEDTRTAEPSGIQPRVHAQRICRHTHVRSTKLHVYPGCWGEYAARQASGSRDVDQTTCGTYPAILVKYARNGVPERTTGSWMRLNPYSKKRKHGTHVSDSNCEKEEKNPEVEMKPLARRSTLIGHPEREEPEQPGRVEGNCEISLHVKQSVSAQNDRESVRDFAPARRKVP